MFDGGFSSAELAADLPLFDALSALAVCENKWEFEKIALAAELWEAWFERDARSGGDVITDCGNNALAEMALRLGCSKTMVENYAMLGIDLRLRLPLTRAAFSAGKLDYPRAAKICRLTTGFTQKTVELAEPDIVGAAETLSPGPLGSAIDRILIAIAPDEVAERRVDATAFRKLRKRRDNDLGIFEAALAPDECEATWQRIAEVAGTVCKYDRRNKQYRLVDAFMALIHGEDRLQCRCERSDCTSAKTPSSKRRTPLVQVSVDIPTLLGLLSNPAYLDGYGPIDPAFARELAADGTWQAMLTEALDMAKVLGAADGDETNNVAPESESASTASTASTAGRCSSPSVVRPGGCSSPAVTGEGYDQSGVPGKSPAPVPPRPEILVRKGPHRGRILPRFLRSGCLSASTRSCPRSIEPPGRLREPRGRPRSAARRR